MSNFPHVGCRYSSRREMLGRSVLGMGSLALAGLLAEEGRLFASEGGKPHLVTPNPLAKAKSVIFLMMGGGPGHMDTFDPKPELTKLHGKPVPASIAAAVPKIPRAGLNKKLMGSPFQFQRYGKSGLPVSELFPHTAKMVDELCILRSLHHKVPVHGPGEYLTLTGSAIGNRPSLGAWLTYGLGSENKNLPGFVVMVSGRGGPDPQAAGWASGFLPARYQGTVVKAGEGVPYIKMPNGTSLADRRRQLDLLKWMNQRHLQKDGANSELEARIASYELGFRMQSSAPEAFDIKRENNNTRNLYGLDNKKTVEFGTQCLLARRLVERGVRFIQLRNRDWDAHQKLEPNHRRQSAATDKPIAGLLQDLKQRGLLESTLVVWGGEFGRTPTMEVNKGRDHSPAAYTMWMAGGGIKGGQVIGATDPVGYTPIERPLTPHDLHATMLHALGIPQKDLFYRHNNRKEIVTNLGGNIIKEAFA